MANIPAAQRRSELKEYLDGVGLLNLNKSELGRKYGVSDVTIGKDLVFLMKDGKGDVSVILRKFDHAFQLALDRALRSLSTAQGSKETNDSIRTLVVVIHEHLLSLSRLGYNIGENGETGKPTIQQLNDFYKLKEIRPIKFVSCEGDVVSTPRQVETSPGAPDSPTGEEADDLVPDDGREDDEESDDLRSTS